jgi:glycosyltransferase involved in cell wall biosynthesis
MSKELILITSAFPAKGQEPFLIEEVTELANAFNKIHILPLNKMGEEVHELPQNCTVNYTLSEPVLGTQKMKFAVSNPFVVFKALKAEKTKSKMTLDHLLKLGVNSQKLVKFIRENNIPSSSVIYSYWLDEGAGISVLAKPKLNGAKCISRAHGYDLYEEDYPTGFPLFHSFSVKNLDRIVFISQNGKNYFESKYPIYQNKAVLSRLGTKEMGVSPGNSSDVFRVASCSSLVPLKQVDRILESLGQLPFDVEWHHFGDGREREKIESKLDQFKNVTVKLHGHVLNKDVMSYYANNPINVFVNFSTTEGLPVSLMEAISFGIPVIATDVGGTSEVCNSATGQLLNENATVADLAKAIGNFKETKIERLKIQNYWKEHFDSRKNFNEFANFLRGL